MKKVFLMCVGMMVFTACSDNVVAPVDVNPVQTVTINQIGRQLVVDDTVTLTALVAGQEDAVISWGASRDLTNASQMNVSLTSKGFLRVLRAGTTRIIATAGNKSDTLVLVTRLRDVRSVALTQTTSTQVGVISRIAAQLFDARGLPLDTAQRTFRWEVTNPATDLVDNTVATVAQNGLVTGVAPGTARVRLVVDGQASGSVDIAVSLVPVGFVTVTPDTVRLARQGTRQLVARAFSADSVEMTPAVLHTRTWAWTTGTSARAVVSSTGLVTATGVGTTTVTATVGGVSRAAVVIVQ
jgi:hypothetical protein